MNHTYASTAAAAVAAASSPSSSAAVVFDNDDACSLKSERSTRSKDNFSLDSASGGICIKEEPETAAEARARHSRDERRARELGVPFNINEVINLPMDEFNDMLSRHELNEEQLNLCRDIRRRGKNKVIKILVYTLNQNGVYATSSLLASCSMLPPRTAASARSTRSRCLRRRWTTPVAGSTT
jgi:hypothetical protein